MAAVIHKTDGNGYIYCGAVSKRWDRIDAPRLPTTYKWTNVTCPTCALYNPRDAEGRLRGDGPARQRARMRQLSEARRGTRLAEVNQSCMPCVTDGRWPSLWASAAEREAIFAKLCPKHAAQVAEEKRVWASISDSRLSEKKAAKPRPAPTILTPERIYAPGRRKLMLEGE